MNVAQESGFLSVDLKSFEIDSIINFNSKAPVVRQAKPHERETN